MSRTKPNRRTVLAAMGLGLATVGCGSTEAPNGRPVPSCVLTPEGTEGPYYVDTALERRDIREGRPGVPVELRVTVVNASSCAPLQDAVVDIWHADAHGVYSGVRDGDESRFLRGIQHTDQAGVATFSTVFPGWYDNRTVHIHVKVHLGGDEIHTGQLYFAEEVIAAVAAIPPYVERTEARIDNDGDFLFPRGGPRSLLALTGDPVSGYLAEITMGVTT
ncbi:Protocatechuate 3,4-dioxygenase beta subunit [Amycolatopsis marina]|uniref:Protocatechuate 3,4-dioxygenase beta subunit n=1 Tax=Amycolatopsis marina TaxID=490629 RepID=A0A1I1BIZ3_9PSEU|nr:intradiol ring-cleavage dioxygenase [Amycolatopsis marina]SFB48433.1 Protocatechuate 3,4-dioxygenase beta subunit [Amycolatopsis marina]